MAKKNIFKYRPNCDDFLGSFDSSPYSLLFLERIYISANMTTNAGTIFELSTSELFYMQLYFRHPINLPTLRI